MKFMLYFCLCFVFASCMKKELIPLSVQTTKQREASKAKMPESIRDTIKKANDELVKSGISLRALGENNKLPNFDLENEKGEKVKISSIYAKNILVITFYRGGWCPYCKLELKAYEEMIEDFADAGAVIVGISPESKMELKKTRKKNDLSFPLFSDKDNYIAQKLGIAFELSPEVVAIYKKFNIDLEASQGNKKNTLPMPGTYVVDTTGKIIFAFMNPDYTLRAEPSEVLKVVQKIKGVI